MLFENCAAIGLDFAERDCSHPCPLESEAEAANPAKEIEDIQPLTRIKAPPAMSTGGKEREQCSALGGRMFMHAPA
jgi:hypothetical protein